MRLSYQACCRAVAPIARLIREGFWLPVGRGPLPRPTGRCAIVGTALDSSSKSGRRDPIAIVQLVPAGADGAVEVAPRETREVETEEDEIERSELGQNGEGERVTAGDLDEEEEPQEPKGRRGEWRGRTPGESTRGDRIRFWLPESGVRTNAARHRRARCRAYGGRRRTARTSAASRSCRSQRRGDRSGELDPSSRACPVAVPLVRPAPSDARLHDPEADVAHE